MDRFIKILNPVVLAVSSAWSLATIEQTLSIIILVLNIAWILTNLGFKIYKKLKTGDFDGIAEEIREGADALQELKKGDKDK